MICQSDSLVSANIVKESVPNVLLTNQPARKALKSSEKLKVYVTDGEPTKVYDAMYYGKPILGLASTDMQYGMMFRVK